MKTGPEEGKNASEDGADGHGGDHVVNTDARNVKKRRLQMEHDEEGNCCGAKEHDENCQCPSCRGGETLSTSYWNNLYEENERNNTNSEYVMSYHTLAWLVQKYYFQPDEDVELKPTLIPGCGDSEFPILMLEDGYDNIYNTDISTSAIRIMSKKYADLPGLKWIVDDATNMQFEDKFFHNIVDKSLIDCVFWVDDPGVNVDVVISKILSEYHRVLAPGGCCLIVTVRSEEEFLPFVSSREYPNARFSEGCAPRCDWMYISEIIRVQCSRDGRIPRHAKSFGLDDFSRGTDDEENYSQEDCEDETGSHISPRDNGEKHPDPQPSATYTLSKEDDDEKTTDLHTATENISLNPKTSSNNDNTTDEISPPENQDNEDDESDSDNEFTDMFAYALWKKALSTTSI